MVVGASNTTPRTERVVTLVQWYVGDRLYGLLKREGCWGCQTLVKEYGKGHKSNASTRGVKSRLCDLVVD